MTEVFQLTPACGQRLPILVSVPHAGRGIPIEIAKRLRPEVCGNLKDTDWLVDELYDFCPAMGISMISAKLSRYVVDLNRPASGEALYQDQRLQTSVVPRTDFDGRPLYRENCEPEPDEITDRLRHYYEPYHKALALELERLRGEFGGVLLFDAHSIRRSVPAISKDPFPDLILGDREGRSCARSIAQGALETLQASSYQVAYNHPFIGGEITRHYSKIEKGVHTLQLEMAQDLYLDPVTVRLNSRKVNEVRSLLSKMFMVLVEKVTNL